MSQRVSISTGSAFLALVIRKTLTRSSHFEPATDHRNAAGALIALREPNHLAIIDAELLYDGSDGAALRKELLARRAPSIVIDARGRGLPDQILPAPAMVVIRGRVTGDLDLTVVEAELLAAAGNALRLRDQHAGDSPLGASPPLPHGEFPEGSLELIVLGVSTGGPTLLMRLFEEVKQPAIAMLIVQHMPESETAGFAARLGEHSGLQVREVAGGPLLPAGTIGVVRGGGDFRIVRRGSTLHLRPAVIEGNPFHPNLDEVLVSAVAANVAVGAVVLTGMGQDGAVGALAMARKGLPVIAQRPDTCAVAGMPQAVIDNGAARWVQSPEAIAHTLNRWSEAVGRSVVGLTRCQP